VLPVARTADEIAADNELFDWEDLRQDNTCFIAIVNFFLDQSASFINFLRVLATVETVVVRVYFAAAAAVCVFVHADECGSAW
jgi:hypothetical protein